MSLPSALPSDLRLIPFLFCYVGGIVLSTQLQAIVLSFDPLLSLSLPLIALFILVLFRRNNIVFVPLIGLLCILLGFVHGQGAMEPSDRPESIHQFVGREPIVVEGIIERIERRAAGETDLLLRTTGVAPQEGWQPATGLLLVQIRQGEFNIPVGGSVRFWGRVRVPRSFGTPGEFNYPRYLASQGIVATAVVKSAGSMAQLPVAVDGLHSAIAHYRRQLADVIDRAVAPADAGIVRGLLLGEKRMIVVEDQETLRQSGLSHLFSVSGMHFGIVGFLSYSVIALLYRRSERLLRFAPPARIIPFLLIPLLYCYYELTGGALPTRRAFLMALIVATALLVSRRISTWGILIALAFIMLLAQPLLLYSASFLLSFAGVAGIILVVRGEGSAQQGWLARLLLFIKITLAAALATAPFALACFHQLAPAVVVTNIVAVPLVGFVALPLGVLSLLLSGVVPEIAGWCLQVVAWLVRTALELSNWIVSLPGMHAWQIYPDAFVEIGVAAVAVALLLLLSRKDWRPAALLLAVAFVLLSPLPKLFAGQDQLRVILFSVGQGESILVTLPDGRNVLVDGGGFYSDRFDVGERLLLPALGRLAIDKLDLVVLSHAHPDHRKGLVAVFNRLKVDRLLLNADLAEQEVTFQQAVTNSGSEVMVLEPTWQQISGFESLWFWRNDSGEENDRSIALYVNSGGEGSGQENGQGGVLLTADLEAEGVRAVVNSDIPGSVSLLKMPHHGSKNSSPELLLDDLEPEVAAVSAGYGNRHRLPSVETLALLKERQIPLYRTDLMGTIEFTLYEGQWQAKVLKKQAF